MLKTKDLYDISHTRAASLLENTEYPWEALPKIKELILEIGPQLPKDEFDEVSESVWIAKDAVIYPNNYISCLTMYRFLITIMWATAFSDIRAIWVPGPSRQT